ncbi:uncharacterized protein nanos [Prorops nasuta]|uniref:uncharacterized protein nanos n=1 Tax=Prorops nasuta TaxID=863751 RepID=UPI0034CF1BF4
MRVRVQQQLPMPQVSNSFFPFNPSLWEEIQRLFSDWAVENPKVVFPNTEDVMEEFRLNGRDFEYCPDLESNIIPIQSLQRKKVKKDLPDECVFCKNNGETEEFYRGHILKDAYGKIICPVLRQYKCKICGASGDYAHTRKYCPKNTEPALRTINEMKMLRNSMGRRRNK